MIGNAWDGSTAVATGLQVMRNKLCMGWQCLVLASLEAKRKQTFWRRQAHLQDWDGPHIRSGR